MRHFDALVVGAGVVGLAIGRRLVAAGLRTVIVDGERTFGTWTSSRNSEVIHAGIYYEHQSLKETLCIRGRQMLYRFCQVKGVPHKQIGKLIFAATPGQVPAIDTIIERSERAGISDLLRLDGKDAASLEPELKCYEAIFSPSTGIIDSHAYMSALLAEIEAGGGIFVPRTMVERLSRRNSSWSVYLREDEDPVLSVDLVVNSCGLDAHRLARATEGLAHLTLPPLHYARGVYFNYGKVPFSRLIYPIPAAGGLGTHLTVDLQGMGRFGPDLEWIDAVDYTVSLARHAAFVEAARLIWRELDPSQLVPGFAGVRPKLSGPGEPPADFAIHGQETHCLPGLVNLFGIESPGLTASLAIADLVAYKLGLADQDVILPTQH